MGKPMAPPRRHRRSGTEVLHGGWYTRTNVRSACQPPMTHHCGLSLLGCSTLDDTGWTHSIWDHGTTMIAVRAHPLPTGHAGRKHAMGHLFGWHDHAGGRMPTPGNARDGDPDVWGRGGCAATAAHVGIALIGAQLSPSLCIVWQQDGASKRTSFRKNRLAHHGFRGLDDAWRGTDTIISPPCCSSTEDKTARRYHAS
jgi:hypothetical protein